jgi:hypothetical protein
MHRPGDGGKIDLGHVLLEASSFSLNTTASRIYTQQNLTLTPGTGGHVEVVQPRGGARLDLRTEEAASAQINLQNSGSRRQGAGQYTVAVREDGAFAISIGRPKPASQWKPEEVLVVEEAVEVKQEMYVFNMSYTAAAPNGTNSSNINATTATTTRFSCASAQWWGWEMLPTLNETLLLLNDSSYIADILNRSRYNLTDESELPLDVLNVSSWNATNATNATLLNATNATDIVAPIVVLVQSFFYKFENRTFLCLEMPEPPANSTQIEAVSAADTVRNWVTTNPKAEITLSVFQLHYAANRSVPLPYTPPDLASVTQGELLATDGGSGSSGVDVAGTGDHQST